MHMEANTKIVCKALRQACAELNVRVCNAWTDRVKWVADAGEDKRYVVFEVGYPVGNADRVLNQAYEILQQQGYYNRMWVRNSNPNFITVVTYLDGGAEGELNEDRRDHSLDRI
jgi:hypothetical protein